MVEFAVDGVEGQVAFRPGKFDAVLTDFMMPRMNGHPRIPLVASSGMTGELERAAECPEAGLLQLGVETLLLKPYTEAQLVQVLAAKLNLLPAQKKG